MSDTALPVELSGSETTSGSAFTSDDIGALLDKSESPSADASSATAPAPTAETSRETGATVPPAGSAPEPGPDQPGPIPFDRHKAALENARTEKQRELESLRQRFSWAEQVNPQEAEQALRLFRWVQADPDGFEREWQSQRTRARTETPPEPDLRAEDGTPVYSAPQMQKLLQFQQRQLLAQFESQLAPVQAKFKANEQAEQAHKATSDATSIVTQARKSWPQFEPLEAGIKARMQRDPTLNLEAAYIAEFSQRGPTLLEERMRTQQADALRQKSAAATTRPGVQVTTPRDLKSMDSRDLTEHIMNELEGIT